jgi:hypothetical protein
MQEVCRIIRLPQPKLLKIPPRSRATVQKMEALAQEWVTEAMASGGVHIQQCCGSYSRYLARLSRSMRMSAYEKQFA